MRSRWQWVLAPCLACFPCAAAWPRIATPSLAGLLQASDLVVVGAVVGVETLSERFPAGAVGGLIACLAAAVIQRSSRQPRARSWTGGVVLCGCLLLSIPACMSIDRSRHGARCTLRIDEVLRGVEPQRTIGVRYQTDFVCDATAFDSGKEYALFLRRLAPGEYELAWHQMAQLEVSEGSVHPTWRPDEASISLAELAARVRRR